MSSLLSITDLHISVDDQQIVQGVTLEINPGETHAIMGPNGSGKSTLVNALMGHPRYEITQGSVAFQGRDLLSMEPHERARAGLFLAFQYPKEIAGVTLRSFLFAAYNAQMAARDPDARKISPVKFQKFLLQKMETLKMDSALAERAVNQGFSGGEKKKAEILQLHVLSPSLALLDETDSGLDVDALKVVADGVSAMGSRKIEKSKNRTADLRPLTFDFSALIVTHYARILQYIQPDHVHVMIGGQIVESGGADLAKTLEEEGYDRFKVQN